ncbi:MAG: DNA adenine methylase [Saprospiraceae bacterium]
MKNKFVKPFVKWAGGKRQLLPKIGKCLPKNYARYYEPFLGGGAVWLALQPKDYVVSDINSEMINVYQVVKSNLEELLDELREYPNQSDFYYKTRELDRSPEFQNISAVKKAARIIYLNKTCFNGLFRVNSQGFFNVPFGNYPNPDIVNEVSLRAANRFLNEQEGEILSGDFEAILKGAPTNSFVYLDPPYDPVSDSSSFTGYALGGFDRAEQQRLKAVCDDLNKRGCKFLLSNSATDFIKDLYKEYTIEIVEASRSINSVATGRGKVEEVLIRNYDKK